MNRSFSTPVPRPQQLRKGRGWRIAPWAVACVVGFTTNGCTLLDVECSVSTELERTSDLSVEQQDPEGDVQPPAIDSHPAPETEPTLVASPVAEGEPAVEAHPVAETDPLLDAKPAVDAYGEPAARHPVLEKRDENRKTSSVLLGTDKVTLCKNARIRGSTDPDILHRVIRAHLSEVQYCHRQGRERDPDMAGKIDIEFTLDPAGSVTQAAATSSTLNDEGVVQCLIKAFSRWKFPKPQDENPVVMICPITLSTIGAPSRQANREKR